MLKHVICTETRESRRIAPRFPKLMLNYRAEFGVFVREYFAPRNKAQLASGNKAQSSDRKLSALCGRKRSAR